MKKFFTLCALLASACFSAVAAEDLTIAPAFTGWAGTDNTTYTKGVVKMTKQWMQLQISGLTGQSAVTAKVVLSEPFVSGFQLCIDYEDGTSEWPQFTAGESEVTVTTKDAPIKNFGIQRQEDGEMSVGVEGVFVDGAAVTVGGGWNDGFAGDADVYAFNIEKQWGAAQFAVNQDVADYSSIVFEWEKPCLENYQINVNYVDATGATVPAYGVADPTGQTTLEVPFKEEWGKIVSVDVQYTAAEGASTLVIKKATLKAAGATGLNAIETVAKDAEAINLFGQKANKAEGFMIKGDKKVYVK